jgi:hypothetical protein
MNPAEMQWSYDTMAPTPKLQYVIRDKYAIGSGFAWRRSLWPGWAPIGLFPTEQDAARAVYWR